MLRTNQDRVIPTHGSSILYVLYNHGEPKHVDVLVIFWWCLSSDHIDVVIYNFVVNDFFI